MNHLESIFIVWIVFYYTYRLIGLFARRRERMLMIEKMNVAEGKMELPGYPSEGRSFTGLRLGCLLIGVGLGLLIGLFVNAMFVHANYEIDDWRMYETAYGACVLLFGGIGLLVSYPLERKLMNRDASSQSYPKKI